MELTKIEIDNYKSIKSPVTVSFTKDLPTILIGKNGSGKTNILEALAVIAMANSNDWSMREQEQPAFRAYIQLTEEDVATMLPEVVYDKDKCEIVAYSTNGDLKIDRVHSEYIVSSLKKEIEDIRDLASRLKDAVDIYEKQLYKISHDGYDELPINCYQLKNANGGLTSYNTIRCQAEFFIKHLHEVLEKMLQTFDDDDIALTFIADNYLSFGFDRNQLFTLEYVEPTLAKFEEKFVSINRTAIKREITKINKATKESCDNINRLIKEIEARTARIQEGLDTDRLIRQEQEEKYYSFLRRVKHIIGKKCLFLKNESRDVFFQKEDRNFYYDEHSRSITETYLRQVYQGIDREELLKNPKEIFLSAQAVADFEDFLNKNIPAFDRDMYESISVQAGEKGQVSIFINEKSGQRISLHETSAGRRWYFTYYFMKNILNDGDIFIIDEPAAMLHPSAQKEVLADLAELTKRGIKVVYSTHSPYLIPQEWKCVQFVTMTSEGTKVSNTFSNQELLAQLAEIVGEDIFDIQTVFDLYAKGDQKKIGKNCYIAIKNKTNDLEVVSSQLLISVDTIKSWNRNGDHFRCPKLENVMAVCKYTNLKIKDLLN
ncbi:MAG: AAA family ATPase [Clostridiales bacterium]|nr:AAA family ATPase [Clostridiales bacterium]